uniref:UDP-glycosyltransferase 83A1-like n=1 Tax=Ananas comosus var. bracteatus TaxID=296719 RepID=A0A6V7Q4X5_ANACO|nr:unnamed protein product [Ananas comosus var. bracteatus]
MGIAHALILPFPAQGHVIPLMELSHCLADRGFEITFVNTEFDHGRIVAALRKHELESDRVRHVSVPDGLAPDEDRNNLGRLVEGLHKSMPTSLEEVIRKNNEKSGGSKITCMIVDQGMAWALEIAEKLGVRCVVFWPMCAALLALIMSTPKLIDDGIIDEEGFPKGPSTFQLSDGMPLMETARLPWNVNAGDEAQKLIFHYMNANSRATKKAEFILCNSFQELESPTFNCASYVLPIGPLLTGLRLGKPFANQTYICDVWRVGLKMVPGESGIITSEHISSRLEELLGDDGIMARARTLKEMANRSMEKEGSSFKNLNTFVEAMKSENVHIKDEE